jgi:Icc-related predicted phosphoesterase
MESENKDYNNSKIAINDESVEELIKIRIQILSTINNFLLEKPKSIDPEYFDKFFEKMKLICLNEKTKLTEFEDESKELFSCSIRILCNSNIEVMNKLNNKNISQYIFFNLKEKIEKGNEKEKEIYNQLKNFLFGIYETKGNNSTLIFQDMIIESNEKFTLKNFRNYVLFLYLFYSIQKQNDFNKEVNIIIIREMFKIIYPNYTRALIIISIIITKFKNESVSYFIKFFLYLLNQKNEEFIIKEINSAYENVKLNNKIDKFPYSNEGIKKFKKNLVKVFSQTLKNNNK